MTGDHEKFWDLLEDNHACMLVTHGPGGTLHARPMYAIPERETREILFYTEVAAGKARELANNDEVCITFISHKKNDFVAVNGRAEVTQDRAMIDRHWGRMVEAWFPKGKDSPNVGMIRVHVRGGEFWDSTSSDLAAMMKMMTAAAAGRRPDLGDNEKVKFG